ncbi:hypothetical protein F5Y01DRAFT_283547 [Xylaria sp. FL0043]|nr:hypothetical protein F5Y01DRAFT_283547 [Xylaria sp. FL0043]
MTTLFASFIAPSRKGDAWFFAGLESSFPNLTGSGTDVLDEPQLCGNGESVPGCKIYHVPSNDSAQAKQVEGDAMSCHDDSAFQDQVLIFRYRGKVHAVDNRCPHSAFPLAKGTPFDIEDFGVVLSAGIHCPKHGWSFDLFTGRADHSNYMLRRWEVELRPAKKPETDASSDDSQKVNEDAEVWVRRKRRIG